MAFFDKSTLASCKGKIPNAYKVILSDLLKGKEFSEEDRKSLAVEIKLAYSDFDTNGIVRALELTNFDADDIDTAVDTKRRNIQIQKETEKQNKQQQKRENAKSGSIRWHTTNDEGKAFVTIENVRIALDHLGIVLKFNQFSNNYEITGLEAHGHTQVTDLSLDHIYFKLQSKDVGLIVSSKKDLDSALNLCAWENRYHPVKDYLQPLVWDGVERLDTWLINYAGVEDNPYTRAVSRLPLMAAVKRVYEPGSVFHEMLILQSEQGWGKSQAIKALCPNPDWFTDDLPLGEEAKIVLEKTQGKWIIEAGEMQNFGKVHHNQMKNFMSRASDRARMAFERRATEVFRQFIIIGTTNDNEFLKDPTGDRRYWPVAMTHEMDENSIKAVRDQLWAEAYHRVMVLKQSIRMDKELWPLAEKAREEFTVTNPYKEAIAAALWGMTGRIENRGLYEICGIPVDNRNGSPKLNKAMKDLGWTRLAPQRRGDGTVRGWAKGGSKQWLDPIFNHKTGKWEFKIDHMTNAQMDKMTQGHIDFDTDELDDYEEPSEKPN